MGAITENVPHTGPLNRRSTVQGVGDYSPNFQGGASSVHDTGTFVHDTLISTRIREVPSFPTHVGSVGSWFKAIGDQGIA